MHTPRLYEVIDRAIIIIAKHQLIEIVLVLAQVLWREGGREGGREGRGRLKPHPPKDIPGLSTPLKALATVVAVHTHVCAHVPYYGASKGPMYV